MRIAVDLPDYEPGWEIAAGALKYGLAGRRAVVLLPNEPLSRPEDRDPATWDGAIVYRPHHDLDIPQVCVAPVSRERFATVFISLSKVVKLAVDQFASMGLVNLAFFSRPNWRLGWNSFSRRSKEAGGIPTFISAQEAEEALIDIPKPCGVLAFNSEVGLGLLGVCRTIGLRVPGDIHVIVIGDAPECRESTPTLSCVSLPLSLVGFQAAKLCAQIINGASVKSIRISPSGLIIRDSIAIEDSDITDATEIAHYLRTNLPLPIRMEDIVRHSSISRRKLEQVFRTAYSASPMAYLKDLRLARAKEMLRTSNAPVKDVARACGYTDSHHLCRIFRTRVGMSPLRYRETRASAKGPGDT